MSFPKSHEGHTFRHTHTHTKHWSPGRKHIVCFLSGGLGGDHDLTSGCLFRVLLFLSVCLSLEKPCWKQKHQLNANVTYVSVWLGAHVPHTLARGLWCQHAARPAESPLFRRVHVFSRAANNEGPTTAPIPLGAYKRGRGGGRVCDVMLRVCTA